MAVVGGVMKFFGWRYFVLACFVVGLGVVAGAQTVGLRVNVPFQFNVGEKVLPEGHYVILAPQGDTLRILGPNGVAALAMTGPASGYRPDGPGAVSFRCYGRRCFLSQFWTARTETGREVAKCRLEKELASEQLAVITLRGTASQ